MEALHALLHLVLPIVALSLFGAFLVRVWKDQTQIGDGPADEAYKVYTSEFDLVLPAHEVLDRLEAASPDGARGWLRGEGSEEEGTDVEALLADQRVMLAPARDKLVANLRSAPAAAETAEFVVAILIDQSGSMKGRRIAFAAVAATLIVELVAELGAQSEVLGFSTAGWRGGHARRKWAKAGRPHRPGRLAALMHVIYQSADDRVVDQDARRVMVHPDLLRENIDGEALLWAWQRLAARPEPRKILIVISDGAPVDDATLLQNGPSYLYRHLNSVLGELAAQPDLRLGGIGVEHRVESFYPTAETADVPEDLPRAGLKLLERLIAAP